MYVDVILPLPLDRTFTYFVPSEMESDVKNGVLVAVNFGRRKDWCYGVVSSIKPNSVSKIKEISSILSIKPPNIVIHSLQLRFWKWISECYFCSIGEVFNVAFASFFVEIKKKKTEKIKQTRSLHGLNDSNRNVLNSIIENFREKEVCLLHETFSYPKIELYSHLIGKILKQNKQVLFLLPETDLTTHVIRYLKYFFGGQLGVYSSQISKIERTKMWNNLLNDEGYRIVLGVRSSIFLPFKSLGLIIITEEHDPNYKQKNRSPKYHARDAAIFLGNLHQAKVLLGSATPSIESFYNVQIGKYGYVSVSNFFPPSPHPEIIPVDINKLRGGGKMKGNFSPLLIEIMKQRLKSGEQVVLFQSKTKFSFTTTTICKNCNWTPKCYFCNVDLFYKNHQLTCHYCGKNYIISKKCPKCGNGDFKLIVWKRGKIEIMEEINFFFPNYQVEIMNFETIKTKKIRMNFGGGKINIVIGPQAIYKKINLEKVGLIGILNADDYLTSGSNFNAHERAFQSFMQLIGKTKGTILLQTFHPSHPLINLILGRDYQSMYSMQIDERKYLNYPPWCKLVQITLSCKKEKKLCEFSIFYTRLLKIQLEHCQIIGPSIMEGKNINFFFRKILLKVSRDTSSVVLRKTLENVFNQLRLASSILLTYEVYPF